MNFFRRKSKDPKAELAEILKGYELPAFPAVVMKVLAMIRDPECALADIAQIIEGDPGMQVRVLTTINSAGIGLANRVGNLHHAVSLLGRSRLESIVLSLAVKSSVPKTPTPFDMKEFWITSSLRAVMARHLAHRYHTASAMESFTAGLLQDIGIPIIATVNGEKYAKLFATWQQNPQNNLVEMETETLGYDHAAIGGLIAQQWSFPEYLVDCISGHHLGEDTIHLAVRLVANIQQSKVDDGMKKLLQNCVKKHGMSEGEFDTLEEKSREDAADFARNFV